MHRRAQIPQFPLLVAPLILLVATQLSRAQNSLCDSYHVPAGHIGNVQGCVLNGDTATITFNAPAILHWDRGFKIDANQNLQFIFPAGVQNGTVLNRDTSGGNSVIAGTMSSNGRVMLINPSGNIDIHPGALIDTDGGFLASTLDSPDDEALLSGADTEFSGSGFLTGIRNQGTIRSSGGDIILVGHSIINEDGAQILAPSGSIYIGAGTRVRLADNGESRITVLDGDPQHVLTNDGTIEAANTIDLSSFASNPIPPPNRDPAIANNGIIRTTSTDGRVFLRANPGGSQILNSSFGGTIQSANLIVEGELINEGSIIDPNDGSNPSAPSGTRQFPRLTSSGLSDSANSDFRLSRLSFSHLNGLASKTGKKTKSPRKSKANVVATNTRTTTRGTSEAEKKKKAETSSTGKKIVLRRGTFFGKKTK